MKTTAIIFLAAAICICFTAGNSFGKNMMNMDFAELDINNDGSLNFEEYKTAFPSSERKGFDFLDSNKDSSLSREEWKKFMEMHKGMGNHHGKKYHDTELPDPKGFNAHFGDIDNDNDDLVTVTEFQSYFPGKNDSDKVFNAVDTDKNGSLDHDEWHAFKQAHELKHIE